MGRTVIEIALPGRQRREFRVFDSGEVHVGRGLQNDLILPDAYVSRRHLLIRPCEEGWEVEDLGSRNGLLTGKRKEPVRKLTCRSGDELVVGRTRLRILSPEHPVEPARALRTETPFMRFLSSPAGVGLSVAAMTAVVTAEEYLATWESEPFLKHTATAVVMLIVLLLWSSLWALAGRLAAHRTFFFAHLGLASLFVTALTLTAAVAEYAGFLTASGTAEKIIVALFFGMLFTALLTRQFALATQAIRWKRLGVSAAVSLLLILLALFFEYAAEEEFNPDPAYSVTLNPPFLIHPQARGADAFLSGSERIFSVEEQKKGTPP